MNAETVTFTRTVEIKDADGRPIRKGSVLRNIKDGCTGVVSRISKVGDTPIGPLDQVGDMHVQLSAGSYRCTNIYGEWKHVPHEEQTYRQRYDSWRYGESYYDPQYEQVSEEEYLAVRGIKELLPRSIVDRAEKFSGMDRLEHALGLLAEHLTELQRNQRVSEI